MSTAPAPPAPSGSTSPVSSPAVRPAPAAPRPRRVVRRERRRAATGAAPVDRLDRVLLAVLGLVAVALGTVVLLAGADVVALRSPAALHADAVASAGRHEAAWTAGAVGGGALVAVLALWWAWAQVRRRPERGRLGPTRLDVDGPGRTTLAPAPLARALAADVEQVDGVAAATARLVAVRPVPEVLVTVTAGLDCDLARLRADLEGPLARLAGALGVDAVHADVRLTVARRTTAPRVR